MTRRLMRATAVQEQETVSMSSVASFVFVFYDILLTFDDEVEIIWSKGRKSWIKWQFLFMRYFALAIQLSNLAVELRITLYGDLKLHHHALHHWLIAQVAICFLISSTVEFILMIRVYALYNKNLYVAVGFALLSVAQIVAMSVGIVRSTRRVAIFDIHSEAILDSYPYLGIAAIVSQVAIVILTVAKHYKTMQSGMSSSILSLVCRDGVSTFFVFILTSSTTVVATISNSVYAPMAYFWFISMLPSTGCRLIINLERYRMSKVQTALELSTDFTSVIFGGQSSSTSEVHLLE
ncbi:hypothetical protein AX17_006971 [Amanita inopinata Kibby_2008]|nr:hypothetical protein AX17_006971 [Amanita inopinata Kibby_2008]